MQEVDKFLHGIANMEQHGQVVGQCPVELLLEYPLLVGKARLVPIEVEAYFSDGEFACRSAINWATVFVEQSFGGGELSLDVVGHIFGMDTDARKEHTGMLAAEFHNLGELRFVAACEEHLGDACLLGTQDAGLHIGCEGLGYQVAMGVNDFHYLKFDGVLEFLGLDLLFLFGTQIEYQAELGTLVDALLQWIFSIEVLHLVGEVVKQVVHDGTHLHKFLTIFLGVGLQSADVIIMVGEDAPMDFHLGDVRVVDGYAASADALLFASNDRLAPFFDVGIRIKGRQHETIGVEAIAFLDVLLQFAASDGHVEHLNEMGNVHARHVSLLLVVLVDLHELVAVLLVLRLCIAELVEEKSGITYGLVAQYQLSVFLVAFHVHRLLKGFDATGVSVG